jgi:uncharacterized protein (TIGR01777 family)
MRIVITGGTGQLGQVLARGLGQAGHHVAVIGRGVPDPALRWDGRNDGPWAGAIDGAHAVINLAGRSVNCRYHWDNLNEMMASRIDSALAVGRAIAAARQPPRVWLQASTASIYSDTRERDQTEADGTIDGCAPGAPPYWGYSVHIARAWELALAASPTPRTRKVALRLGFTMSPDRRGIFDRLTDLVRWGLGGRFGDGGQYVSWLSDRDLVGAASFLIARDDLEGPFNLCAPAPIQNAAFMRELRRAMGARWGLPVWGPMADLGAVLLRTDAELMRKSRRVVPARLLDAGYRFHAASWDEAAADLVARKAAAAPSR